MLILAIETTADLCSIAIRDKQGTLVERAFRHRRHLSERLIADVDALLQDAGVTLADIEGFGVGIGPGSFTGVRLGVMTAKTWASVLDKPVVGVSSLEAVASVYSGLTEGLIVPVIRARPGAVYTQVFDGMGQAQGAPEMIPATELPERLQNAGKVLFCGDGLKQYRQALEEAFQGMQTSVVFGSLEAPRASQIAAIAVARIESGKNDDPIALGPLYIAPPPVDARAERPESKQPAS